MPTLPDKKYDFDDLSTLIKKKLLKHNPKLNETHLAHLKLFYKVEDVMNRTLTVGTNDGYFEIPVEKFNITIDDFTIKDILNLIGINTDELYPVKDKDAIISFLPDFITATFDEPTATLIFNFNESHYPSNLTTTGTYPDGLEIRLTSDNNATVMDSGILLINADEYRMELIPDESTLTDLAIIHGYTTNNPLKLNTVGDIIEEIPTT